ncbi:uncharacterized protein LOC141963799 [Athene noctua]|uniref:uncharacterized protein LOC141963739 n=1 Tax=Athene noctua TaxID=126797 RepID=UPI003EBF170B
MPPAAPSSGWRGVSLPGLALLTSHGRDGRSRAFPAVGSGAGAAAAGAGGAGEREGRRTSRACGQQPPRPAGGERLPLRVSEEPSAQSAAGRTASVRPGSARVTPGAERPRSERARLRVSEATSCKSRETPAYSFRGRSAGRVEFQKKRRGRRKEGERSIRPVQFSRQCREREPRPHLVRAVRHLHLLISGGQPGTWSCRRGREKANRRKSLTCQILLAARRTAVSPELLGPSHPSCVSWSLPVFLLDSSLSGAAQLFLLTCIFRLAWSISLSPSCRSSLSLPCTLPLLLPFSIPLCPAPCSY